MITRYGNEAMSVLSRFQWNDNIDITAAFNMSGNSFETRNHEIATIGDKRQIQNHCEDQNILIEQSTPGIYKTTISSDITMFFYMVY